MGGISAYWTLETLRRHETFVLRVQDAEFLVSKSQLERAPSVRPRYRSAETLSASTLACALLGDFNEASTRSVVLDRDPTVYPIILRYLNGVRRSLAWCRLIAQHDILPIGSCPAFMTVETVLKMLLVEARYLGLDELEQSVADALRPFCVNAAPVLLPCDWSDGALWARRIGAAFRAGRSSQPELEVSTKACSADVRFALLHGLDLRFGCSASYTSDNQHPLQRSPHIRRLQARILGPDPWNEKGSPVMSSEHTYRDCQFLFCLKVNCNDYICTRNAKACKALSFLKAYAFVDSTLCC